MWYCKMYFPGRHEVIESDTFGTQGAPSQRKAFPFLESLLSFTELDTGKVAVALRCISDDLESLDRERVTNAMVRLGALADTHSFFRVLYAKWFYFRSVGFENTEAAVSGALDELRSLPEELPLYQKQIQRFFELVLDIDKAGRISDSEFYSSYIAALGEKLRRARQGMFPCQGLRSFSFLLFQSTGIPDPHSMA